MGKNFMLDSLLCVLLERFKWITLCLGYWSEWAKIELCILWWARLCMRCKILWLWLFYWASVICNVQIKPCRNSRYFQLNWGCFNYIQCDRYSRLIGNGIPSVNCHTLPCTCRNGKFVFGIFYLYIKVFIHKYYLYLI